MNVRTRYYIETYDGLFFAVTNYTHPKDYVISFLRYVPSDDGNRSLNGVKYKKVNSSQAYSIIKEKYPNYLIDWNVENKKMMAVAVEDIKRIYNPIEGLKDIRNKRDTNKFYEKIALLTDIFHNECDIPYSDMGISGSTLIGLEDTEESDIDLIIFGRENHKKAREYYAKAKYDKNSPLDCIDERYWKRIFDKRIFDETFTLDEFSWYEFRKNNRGLIKGTLFDISFTKKFEEIENEENLYFRPIGNIKIKCQIIDDSKSYETPAIYNIKDVEILEGEDRIIEKIISFTHTYAGIVKNNERIIASGVCEECLNKDTGKKTYNLVVGTTREAINEYVKLENNPLKE